MKLPTKTIEKKLLKEGYKYIYAVDEVGMGCLAGPVVVCAVMLDRKFFAKQYPKLNRLRDSKLLNVNQREQFAKTLMTMPDLRYELISCSSKTIDRINIYQAARLAMKRAVLKLRTTNYKLQTIVLVDGRSKVKGLKQDQVAIIKGDRKVFSIACASIIAKVYRDKMMIKYAKRYPQYGFEKHKGYGTKLHQSRLIQFGPSAIHRKSFAPVAKLL